MHPRLLRTIYPLGVINILPNETAITIEESKAIKASIDLKSHWPTWCNNFLAVMRRSPFEGSKAGESFTALKSHWLTWCNKYFAERSKATHCSIENKRSTHRFYSTFFRLKQAMHPQRRRTIGGLVVMNLFRALRRHQLKNRKQTKHPRIRRTIVRIGVMLFWRARRCHPLVHRSQANTLRLWRALSRVG